MEWALQYHEYVSQLSSSMILGATYYQFGLISSIWPLISLRITLPAGILLNKAVKQKKLISFSIVGGNVRINGYVVSGMTLIVFNVLLENWPIKIRTYCITSYNVLLAILTFMSMQIGIWLLKIFSMDMAIYISTAL